MKHRDRYLRDRVTSCRSSRTDFYSASLLNLCVKAWIKICLKYSNGEIINRHRWSFYIQIATPETIKPLEFDHTFQSIWFTSQTLKPTRRQRISHFKKCQCDAIPGDIGYHLPCKKWTGAAATSLIWSYVRSGQSEFPCYQVNKLAVAYINRWYACFLNCS